MGRRLEQLGFPLPTRCESVARVAWAIRNYRTLVWMLAQRCARYPRMACIHRRGGRAENCATCNPLATGREAEAVSQQPTATGHQPASHSVSDKRWGVGYLLFAWRPLVFAFNPAQATHCPWVDGWRSEGPCAAWVRRMRRTGWAGRPTPALPCVQDCTHEQAALRAPRDGFTAGPALRCPAAQPQSQEGAEPTAHATQPRNANQPAQRPARQPSCQSAGRAASQMLNADRADSTAAASGSSRP